jgi:hypothetical protein
LPPLDYFRFSGWVCRTIRFSPDAFSAAAIRLKTPLGGIPAPTLPRSPVCFSLHPVSRLIFCLLFFLRIELLQLAWPVERILARRRFGNVRLFNPTFLKCSVKQFIAIGTVLWTAILDMGLAADNLRQMLKRNLFLMNDFVPVVAMDNFSRGGEGVHVNYARKFEMWNFQNWQPLPGGTLPVFRDLLLHWLLWTRGLPKNLFPYCCFMYCVWNFISPLSSVALVHFRGKTTEVPVTTSAIVTDGPSPSNF